MSDQPATTYSAFLESQARDLAFAIAHEMARQTAFFGKREAAEVEAWSEAVVGATLGALAAEEGARERVAAYALDLARRGASLDDVLRALAITLRHFLRVSGPAAVEPMGKADDLARLLDVFDGARDVIGRFFAASADLRRCDGEARFLSLLNAINNVIVIIAEDGRILEWNQAAECVYGWSKEEVLSKNYLEMFLPEDVRLAVAADMRKVLAGDETHSFENPVISRDGTQRILRWSVGRLVEGDGKPAAVVASGQDITALRRIEEERAKLQSQIIDAQRETLRELSTPLLPIADGVVLMPLVGAIDEGRGALVLEALLQGVVAHRAEIAILDITGVRTVDSGVAIGLVQAAQAAGLLGAEVVLTGVRPAAARTIVELGIGMQGIKTLSSLEQGVSHALARAGGRERRTKRNR